MEVPPPFAILQDSRGAERRRISWQVEPGGGWRCAGALGKIFVNAFRQRVLRRIWEATGVILGGELSSSWKTPSSSGLWPVARQFLEREGGDEILCKKVKVLSFKSFCLFLSFIVSA